MLKRNLIKAVNKFCNKGEDWKIVWDNDSTHTSKEMKLWLQKALIHVIHIPSHSPELNIVEIFC